MVSRGEDKYVVWPIYFDKSVSRLAGRKVSKKHAVDKPSAEAISKAAKSLGLNPVLEKNVAYPSRYWKKEQGLSFLYWRDAWIMPPLHNSER